MVHIELKIREKFGWTKTSHRRFNLKLIAENMNQGQLNLLEAAVRKAALSIIPEKEEWEK